MRALVPHARALAAARLPHAPRVEIRCDALNAPSAAVARRLGFHHVHTLRGQHVHGAVRDTLVFRLPTAPDAPPALPTIDTARLRLRPAHAGDVDALWRLWTDADVRRYLWDDRAIERDEAAATVHALGDLAGRGLGLWCLEPIGGDAALVGCAGLLPVDAAAAVEPSLAGMVEPLVALAPDAWGRGLAAEALDALVLHAFAVLELPALAGVTDVPNAASDRMLRRAGFVAFAERPGPHHPLRLYRLEPPSGSAR
jgi:RimJ/RimL family protein N-acetyltransferase